MFLNSNVFANVKLSYVFDTLQYSSNIYVYSNHVYLVDITSADNKLIRKKQSMYEFFRNSFAIVVQKYGII